MLAAEVKVTFEGVKSAYIELYGKFYNEEEFTNFDTAFLEAWHSFDYVSNASDEYDFAQAMTQCWQLQQLV